MEGMAKIDHTQPENQFDLIEAWLANELSPEASKAVEARINSDPDFRKPLRNIGWLINLFHRLLECISSPTYKSYKKKMS